MNDVRKRGRTLLVVEGKTEREELYKKLFHCFSEMNITDESIWIYGTNIYNLYADIENEYGENWYEDHYNDVDLPWLLSYDKEDMEHCDRSDFKNIYLIFDYERHDPRFDENKILRMQNYFNDATNNGQLYINYPMLESYKDLDELPVDKKYCEKRIPASLTRGSSYKNSVRDTIIGRNIELPDRITKILEDYVGEKEADEFCDYVLSEIKDQRDIEDAVSKKIGNLIQEGKLYELTRRMQSLFEYVDYLKSNKSYWEYMKEIFKIIIFHNICKANMIQSRLYEIDREKIAEIYQGLDLEKILTCQNNESHDVVNGYIWVLNTCLFLVPEYNISLIK